MPHCDSDAEQGNEKEEQVEEDEENLDTASSNNDSGKPASDEAADIEDNFDEEEEVLTPKPFPRTIELVLPSSARSALSTTINQQEPTSVHVCLTRGVIGLPVNATAATEGGVLKDSGPVTTATRLQGCCAEAHRFEVDYGDRLAVLRRRHILRRLHGNPDRQRRFLELERKSANRRAQPVGDGEDDHRVEVSNDADPVEGVAWPWTGAPQSPPPYWLPSLLANDVQTFHRVLHVMYGWVIAPEPHPSDQLRLNSAGQLLSGPLSDVGDDDDDEDFEQADPAQDKPDFFLPSNAFSGADDDDETTTTTTTTDAGEREKERSALTDKGEESPQVPRRASKSLLSDFNECEGDGADNAQHPQPFEPSSTEQESPMASSSCPYSRCAPQPKLSTATAPPPVVALPFFPFTNYEFFIVQDSVSGEWHLLDTHPLFVMAACRRRRAEQQQQQQQRLPHEDEDEDEENDDNDRESGQSVDGAAPEPGDQADVSGICPVPAYNMRTLIPVSPIILAALFSAPALRCCLLQPLKTIGSDVAYASPGEESVQDGEQEKGGPQPHQRLSDREVLRTLDHAWLSSDVAVGLPLLATICRARQHVLQQDATRIPYTLGALWLDVSPLFALPGFRNASQHVSPADIRQWCAGPSERALEEEGEKESEEAADKDEAEREPSRPVTAATLSAALPHRWGSALDHVLSSKHYGRVVLSTLLAANILPTRAVALTLLTRLDGLRLALWWWLRLPSRLLRQWGVDDRAAEQESNDGEGDSDNNDSGDDEGNDSDEDRAALDESVLHGMLPEEATEVVAQHVSTLQQRSARKHRRRQQQRDGPVLRFAPLLQRVLLELQRRLDRCHGEDSCGHPLSPSQFTLQESVARTFAVERLDSGLPRQDPLVTTSFVGVLATDGDDAEEKKSYMSGKALSDTAAVAAGATVRHHRLYQSDVVLLALALTTTPAPGQAHMLPQRLIAVDVDDVRPADQHDDDDGSGGGERDAHTALFEHIFEAKLLRCVRSPVDRARAGTTKVLLLCAADFCLSSTRCFVFAHLPSYEFFGSMGYCPLPELVQAWAAAATCSMATAGEQMHRATSDFAFYLWNEVRWRLRKQQYTEATVACMQQQLPQLFACIEAHTKTYYAIMARLQAEAEAEAETAACSLSNSSCMLRVSQKAPQRPSLVSGAVLQATKQEAQEAAYETAMTAASTSSFTSPATATTSPGQTSVPSLPLTVAHPNVYSAAVLASKAHVYELWHTFAVAPCTYLTAETLFVLLFGRASAEEAEEGRSGTAAPLSRPRTINTAALRVLFENGVDTVQPCPLDSVEMPAIEAALMRADVEAVNVLLGLGAASLHDLRADGSTTLESWAETIFSPAEMAVLYFVETKNGRAARSDPRVQYGARRFEATAAQV